jgi:hypothetical protein
MIIIIYTLAAMKRNSYSRARDDPRLSDALRETALKHLTHTSD